MERTANVEITVKWKDDSDEEFQSTTYNLHTKDIPSNQTIITDVLPAGGGKATKIRVKASFETLDSLISQKKLSLSEVEEQLSALKLEMKGGGSCGQGKAKGNASKQSASPKKKRTVNTQPDTDKKLSAFQSTLNITQQMGMLVVAGVYEYRAMVLFGASVVAISLYGDRVGV